jgi:hypothetical protein
MSTANSGHLAVRNVRAHSFEYSLTGYVKDTDALEVETANYMVMERGAHTVADGNVPEFSLTESGKAYDVTSKW